MTFAERLARSREFFARGQSDRDATYLHGTGTAAQSVDGTPLHLLGRADAASYWLGATERDRVRTEP